MRIMPQIALVPPTQAAGRPLAEGFAGDFGEAARGVCRQNLRIQLGEYPRHDEVPGGAWGYLLGEAHEKRA